MKRIIAAVALSLMATVAHAATTFGNWQVNYVKGNSAYVPMCVLNSKPVGGRSVYFKRTSDGAVFIDIVYLDGQNLSKSAEVVLKIGLKIGSGSGTVFEGRATTHDLSGGARALRATAPNFWSTVESLMQDFPPAVFTVGSEPPWEVDMNGSAAAAARWFDCSKAITKKTQAGSGLLPPADYLKKKGDEMHEFIKKQEEY